jgi:peptidoglycan/LPS O-acetylase OafA/YrhL
MIHEQRTSKRIHGFDGLRAIAFLLVFVSHKAPTALTERYGTAGVWLFFVLSGFLITRILSQSSSEIEAGNTTFFSRLLDFYVHRTLRIFPIYYLFLAVVMALGIFGLMDIGTKGRQLANLFFLSNVYVEYRGWANDLGHLWSLAVEEQFYLFFAPLALALPQRRLPFLCISIIFLSVATHLVLLSRGSWHISFDVNSFVNFGLLGLGGIAGLYADRRLPSWLVSDVAIVVTFCLFLVAPIFMSEPWQYLHLGRISGFAIALLLVQIYQNQQGLASSYLNSRPLREIGVISYGAYLIHPVIHLSGILNFFGIRASFPLWVSMIFELSVTLALAEISWRFLEKPVKGTSDQVLRFAASYASAFRSRIRSAN